MTPEEQAAQKAKIDAAKAEVQPLIDNFANAILKAVNDAVTKALNEALPMIAKDWLNARLQGGEAAELNKRGNMLNEKLRTAEADLEQERRKNQTFADHPEVKAAALARKKAVLARLAQEVAAEESPADMPTEQKEDGK